MLALARIRFFRVARTRLLVPPRVILTRAASAAPTVPPLEPPAAAQFFSETPEQALALSGFSDDDVAAGAGSSEAPDVVSPRQRQIDLEVQQLDRTVAQYRDVLRSVISVGRGSTIPISQRFVVEWFGPLVRAIDAEQAACMSGKPGDDRRIYGQYLVLLPPDKLAVITMHVRQKRVYRQRLPREAPHCVAHAHAGGPQHDPSPGRHCQGDAPRDHNRQW